MAFLCPECQRSRALEIVQRLELPPDSRSDEITVQIIRCRHCDFQGAAVYQESRRGALDSESFDHTGYHLPPAELEKLMALIRRCPRPRDPRCDCPSHQQLGPKDQGGRWIDLTETAGAFNPFPLLIHG